MEQYELLEEIGKGRFGIVHKVEHKATGAIHAAKIVKCIKMDQYQKVRDEVNIMKSLSHPKLLRILAAYESIMHRGNRGPVTLIME